MEITTQKSSRFKKDICCPQEFEISGKHILLFVHLPYKKAFRVISLLYFFINYNFIKIIAQLLRCITNNTSSENK